MNNAMNFANPGDLHVVPFPDEVTRKYKRSKRNVNETVNMQELQTSVENVIKVSAFSLVFADISNTNVFLGWTVRQS